MNFLYKYARKIVIGLVGTALIILGIVLIPLPGPGFLVIFAGLFVLSLEFEWVKPHVERAKKQVRKITPSSTKAKRK